MKFDRSRYNLAGCYRLLLPPKVVKEKPKHQETARKTTHYARKFLSESVFQLMTNIGSLHWLVKCDRIHRN